MKKPTPITFSELMKEVERTQSASKGRMRFEFSSEQKKFIDKCLEKQFSYQQIISLWSKKWDPIHKSTIYRYKCEKKDPNYKRKS